MKRLLVLLATIATLLVVTIGYSKTNPKFALGDKVVLVNSGFYRNCSFPAFVERMWDDGQYSISFYCPSHYGDKQYMNLNVKESEITLYEEKSNDRK